MSWLLGIIASAAIWIVAFLAMSPGGYNFYSLLMLFLVVPLFFVPLSFVFCVAAGIARAGQRRVIGRLLLFYGIAVPLAGAGAWLMYRARMIPLEPESALQLMQFLLVPSLLSSLAYPATVLRA